MQRVRSTYNHEDKIVVYSSIFVTLVKLKRCDVLILSRLLYSLP